MSGGYADLAGKVVVITGGSRGLGAQTAREFAEQGAKVCVVGRDAEALDGVVAGIVKGGGSAIAVQADVTDSTALAWVRELVTMIHLAKFTGAPPSRATPASADRSGPGSGASRWPTARP